MFDFGFWELAIIMVIALLVVGPEKLPTLAGQVGRFVGKAKRVVNNLRSDIESEIKAAEFKQMLEQQQNEIGELKQIINKTQSDINKGISDIAESASDSGKAPQGDRELIKAVEKHIESTKQRELSLNSESDKHEHD